MQKSHFNYHRLCILGHIVSGRTPDPEKIAAVLYLADPTSDKEIMHFSGLTAFNRDYTYRVVDLIEAL